MYFKKKLSNSVKAAYSKDNSQLLLQMNGDTYFRLNKDEMLNLRDFINKVGFSLDLNEQFNQPKHYEVKNGRV